MFSHTHTQQSFMSVGHGPHKLQKERNHHNIPQHKKPQAFNSNTSSLFFLAMAIVLRKTVGPHLAVGDLMNALERHLKRCGSKDLLETLEVPDHKAWGWKRALHPAWMVKCSAMACDLNKISKNGVISSQKLKLAIQKLLDEHKCTTSKDQAVLDCVDLCDQKIRVLLAQFRKAKDNKDEYFKVCRKLSPKEKLKLDEALASLGQQEVSPEKEAPAEHRMVAFQNHSQDCNASSSSMAGLGIFQRVLSKKDSDTSEVSLPAPPATSVPAQTLASKPFMLVGDPCFASQESSLEATFASDSEAAFSERQSKKRDKEPPKKEKKSKKRKKHEKKNVEDHEKQKKKEKQEKTMVKHREAADFLSSGEEAAIGEVLALELPRPRKQQKAKKKPAAASKVLHEKPDSKKNKGHKGGSKKDEKEGIAEVEDKKRKSSFKHRKTSSAYHAAKLQAVKAGKSECEAKALGRAAGQKVASEIDAGLLKEL